MCCMELEVLQRERTDVGGLTSGNVFARTFLASEKVPFEKW